MVKNCQNQHHSTCSEKANVPSPIFKVFKVPRKHCLECKLHGREQTGIVLAKYRCINAYHDIKQRMRYRCLNPNCKFSDRRGFCYRCKHRQAKYQHNSTILEPFTEEQTQKFLDGLEMEVKIVVSKFAAH